MDVNEFAERIFLNLPYDPNNQQVQLIAALARFCSRTAYDNPVFLLAGYAGTGKTSLIGALVRTLLEVKIPVVLLAPTGRAAKVFSSFAGHPASTIHRRIYRSADGSLGFGSTEVAENTLHNAVFIVDEASMIGAGGVDDDTSNLLSDLIHYVYTGDDCRMILMGDTAQLPPVGCSESPAMNPEILRRFGLHVSRVTLTEVVRQQKMSGILYNATHIRRDMRSDPIPEPHLKVTPFADVDIVAGEDLEDSISASYADEGLSGTLVITRSNKRAVLFNLAIRNRILGREEQLCRGELLMIAKNNYLWSAKVKGLDFVANGDMAEVEYIHGVEQAYGMTFADVTLRLLDRDISFDCKLMLDTLTSEAPALERDRFNQLYTTILNDPDLFTPSTPVKTRMKILRSDPYVNALQVKYAYCVTCHKAQGGQWPSVYVDLGYTPPTVDPLENLRWVYTAITRSTSTLHLVNPPEEIID
ncbi:MAG: AAA family ATPase [Bacteroides sp.]|nr:AAA family ATPase [Bacteroides sp.]MCM1413385.1 AAA family ATPase [Bacteroides sp.]MCM1471929.1 AAA family ATPase [Bacteroides sp.]